MDIQFDFIASVLNQIKEPTLKVTKIAKKELEKFKIKSKIAFTKYLENSYEKYSKIKTVLYRTEPKYIYDFFEYPTLRKSAQRVRSSKVSNITSISNFIIIEGTGGIGKSTLMKHLFINAIEEKKKIPIFIELKNWNDTEEIDLIKFVFDRLNTLGSEIDYQCLEYALKSGSFLFLLDGFDEVKGEKRGTLFKQLESFCDRYSTNDFIVSSRPYSEFIEFQRFTVLKMSPLSQRQAVSLIKKLEFDEEIKERFVEALSSGMYVKHSSFASNPLLLNIMLLTFDHYAEIPEKLHIFYSNAFETLYSKHDATKAGYRREMKSHISYEDFKMLFSCFCFITYHQGKIEFSCEDLKTIFKKVQLQLRINSLNIDDYIYDLVNAVCVLCVDGLEYKFTHRSFQEYFAALFLKELPDNSMSKAAIDLIKKDTNRVIHDNVFKMLYDMCEKRVEQNIFLPIIDELDAECDSSSKYDYYFARMEIGFDYLIPDGEETLCLVMPHTKNDDIACFIRGFAWYYRNRNSISEEKQAVAEAELLEFISNSDKGAYSLFYSYEECKASHEIYEMLKDTWIGDTVQTICTLGETLRHKNEEDENNLFGMLALV